MNLDATYAKRWIAVAGSALCILCVFGAGLFASRVTLVDAVVPAPTGPSRVGAYSAFFRDEHRNDLYLQNGTRRELVVQLWYPTDVGGPCTPAPYTSARVWTYLESKLRIKVREPRTNSCLNAPIAAGSHPLVLLTPGYTGNVSDYTYLAEDLGSHGYIVAAVGHTYESTAVEFPDTTLRISMVGTYVEPTSLQMGLNTLTLALNTRVADLQFVMDELYRLNRSPNGKFSRKLDPSRIAVIGHSLGAIAGAYLLRSDPRVKAAVAIDADAPKLPLSSTATPLLLIVAGREHWSGFECELWQNTTRVRNVITLQGANHFTPSDAGWLFGYSQIRKAKDTPSKTLMELRFSIRKFLDDTFMGNHGPPVRTTSSGQCP